MAGKQSPTRAGKKHQPGEIELKFIVRDDGVENEMQSWDVLQRFTKRPSQVLFQGYTGMSIVLAMWKVGLSEEGVKVPDAMKKDLVEAINAL